MKVKSGFTLIEILISLGIFSYVFSGLMVLFLQFSKSHNPPDKCSSFSFLLIQKALTESDNLDVASSGDEVSFDNKILKSEANSLYFYEKDEDAFKIDTCSASFSKNSTTTSPLLETSKCLDIQYEHSSTQTVCALK